MLGEVNGDALQARELDTLWLEWSSGPKLIREGQVQVCKLSETISLQVKGKVVCDGLLSWLLYDDVRLGVACWRVDRLRC
jgi:hypothetical protein